MGDNNQNINFWQRFLKTATQAKSIENEEEILLDHDYDGIKELDNVLPPWWLWGFFITIGISVFYYLAIHILGWYGQDNEYDQEVAEFQQYKAQHPELFSTDNLVAKMDEVSIAKGKQLFETKTCTACHLQDGGGLIGPNLTDEYWILGGDFKSVFNTISKGGRPGKGMVDWEKTISKEDRQLLASYVLSLQGTTPANPKPKEGDKWVDGKKGAADVGVSNEQVTLNFNNLKIEANKGGVEEQFVKFLQSEGYKKMTKEELKDKWFDFDNINFEMGATDRLTEGAMKQLENIAKLIKSMSDVKIKLGAYTDKKGDDALNLQISQKRADFLKAKFEELGLGKQINGAEGYGEQLATVDETASDEERAVDRKMSFRLVK